MEEIGWSGIWLREYNSAIWNQNTSSSRKHNFLNDDSKIALKLLYTNRFRFRYLFFVFFVYQTFSEWTNDAIDIGLSDSSNNTLKFSTKAQDSYFVCFGFVIFPSLSFVLILFYV